MWDWQQHGALLPAAEERGGREERGEREREGSSFFSQLEVSQVSQASLAAPLPSPSPLFLSSIGELLRSTHTHTQCCIFII